MWTWKIKRQKTFFNMGLIWRSRSGSYLGSQIWQDLFRWATQPWWASSSQICVASWDVSYPVFGSTFSLGSTSPVIMTCDAGTSPLDSGWLVNAKQQVSYLPQYRPIRKSYIQLCAFFRQERHPWIWPVLLNFSAWFSVTQVSIMK